LISLSFPPSSLPSLLPSPLLHPFLSTASSLCSLSPPSLPALPAPPLTTHSLPSIPSLLPPSPFLSFLAECRYTILAPKAVPPGFLDSRKATDLLIKEMQLSDTEYRMGHSKVFFKAGVLGRLEDLRDERLGIIIAQLQAYCRGYLMRKQYKKLQEQRLALAVIQRNVRKHLFIRDWKWWKLFTKIKPMLKVVHTEQELKQKDEEVRGG